MNVLFTLFGVGCSVEKPELVDYTEGFRAVQDAVTKRDGAVLLRFAADDSDTLAQSAAWRALASTPSAPTDSVLGLATRIRHPLSGFALSTRAMDGGQLRLLESHAIATRFQPGLVRALGMQGDTTTAAVFAGWIPDAEGLGIGEAELALAHSMLTVRRVVPAMDQSTSLSRLMATTDAEAARNWLYAVYRSAAVVWADSTADRAIRDMQMIRTMQDDNVRRFFARALAKSGKREALDLYPADQVQALDVLSAVDLVRLLPHFKDSLPAGHVSALLGHPSPVVKTALLGLLADSGYAPYEKQAEEIESLINGSQNDPRLYLSAVWARMKMPGGGDYRPDTATVRRMASQDPYFTQNALQVLTDGSDAGEMLTHVNPFLKSSTHLERIAAVNVLGPYVLQRVNNPAFPSEKAVVREVLWDAVSTPNRSVMASLGSLLQVPAIAEPGDAQRFVELLRAYSLPADVEVYQTILPGVLRSLGPDAAIFADSLAGYGVSALNRQLVDFVSPSVRADIEANAEPVALQGPEWTLLDKLGTAPRLQLEMELGLIEIELDPVRAPATVSAIARLAESGMYNGVAFHRVVPNFVIQGGDVETGDGFGGPDFTLPNEPSDHSFVRGASGIASAGKDTEGSQYFMMIDWAPHLDGGYTIFGHVVEGQAVVDRIRVGDRVIRARVTNF